MKGRWSDRYEIKNNANEILFNRNTKDRGLLWAKDLLNKKDVPNFPCNLCPVSIDNVGKL